MTPAELACRVASLGLSTADLAEIGGVAPRTAQYWLSGRDNRGFERHVPDDVAEAILAFDDDVDVIADHLADQAQLLEIDAIPVYRSTEDLRCARPDIPGRGHAAGGFAGVWRIAALAAWDAVGQAVPLAWAERAP